MVFVVLTSMFGSSFEISFKKLMQPVVKVICHVSEKLGGGFFFAKQI